MSKIILKQLLPCIEDVVEESDLQGLVFKLELNDIFDELMYADLKVDSYKDKYYENASYILCRDCFNEIIGVIPDESLQ